MVKREKPHCYYLPNLFFEMKGNKMDKVPSVETVYNFFKSLSYHNAVESQIIFKNHFILDYETKYHLRCELFDLWNKCCVDNDLISRPKSIKAIYLFGSAARPPQTKMVECSFLFGLVKTQKIKPICPRDIDILVITENSNEDSRSGDGFEVLSVSYGGRVIHNAGIHTLKVTLNDILKDTSTDILLDIKNYGYLIAGENLLGVNKFARWESSDKILTCNIE